MVDDKVKKEAPGLGDAIHTITQYLKIKECDKCKKRREFLNKYRLPNFKV
jgi:hypothetical protein